MKVGTVALIGRPNSGKSTLVNALVGQKVAITSPLPQTTQFPIFAVYQDDMSNPLSGDKNRGQIIFVDTPGIFAKASDQKAKDVNLISHELFQKQQIDVLIYLIDPTRPRGFEENRVLGMVRKINAPKILVINKIDVKEPNYREQYRFLEEEFDSVVEVSALRAKNLSLLISELFNYLKSGEELVKREDMVIPALNVSSKVYIEEIIREKVFLNLREELPYKIKVIVDDIEEKKTPSRSGTEALDMTVIKARIVTVNRYKKMIIGRSGRMIKEIGMAARKELELSSRRKVYLELKVEGE